MTLCTCVVMREEVKWTLMSQGSKSAVGSLQFSNLVFLFVCLFLMLNCMSSLYIL